MSIERADPNVWDTDDAKSHPVWYSTLFEVKARRFIMSWVNDLELHTVGDTVQRDGSNYTEREILEYFEEHFEQTDDGTAFLTPHSGWCTWQWTVVVAALIISPLQLPTLTAISHLAWMSSLAMVAAVALIIAGFSGSDGHTDNGQGVGFGAHTSLGPRPGAPVLSAYGHLAAFGTLVLLSSRTPPYMRIPNAQPERRDSELAGGRDSELAGWRHSELAGGRDSELAVRTTVRGVLARPTPMKGCLVCPPVCACDRNGQQCLHTKGSRSSWRCRVRCASRHSSRWLAWLPVSTQRLKLRMGGCVPHIPLAHTPAFEPLCGQTE